MHVEDAVESSRRAFYLGGYEGWMIGHPSVGNSNVRLEVSLEMKSGEIQKRNLSLQVGFSLQNQSMVVLCLAEESTQAMAYVCILRR
nr:hypothetical protein Iba_chr03eCG0500 [Ipomoea batatas]